MTSDEIKSDQIRPGENRKVRLDEIRLYQITNDQLRSDQMIKFNQMTKTSTQLLWDLPDQPLWLPLVCVNFFIRNISGKG